jgi:peptide chain release factor subunit 1
LARLLDEHPRFAVLVADTRSARILVFSRGGLVDSRAIEGRRSRRTDVGGWSQMRFQRHVDGIREHNVRETVAALERVVEKDRVQHVVIAGDEAALPIFREALSKDLAKRVIDILRLDVRTPEKKILEEALEALREWDARSDAEKVQRVVDDYRAGGLGVVGPEGVEAALAAGQVDELLISASLPSPSDAAVGPGTPGAKSRERGPDEESHRRTAEIADELVAKARQTSARVTFIQDTTLLAPYGGVAATLRFRLAGTARVVSSP